LVWVCRCVQRQPERACIVTAKRHISKSLCARNRKPTVIGPNQFSLIEALWQAAAKGNRFRSMTKWFESPHAIGGSRESRRQSCWAVIRRGWAKAKKRHRGGREYMLTQAGRDIAEGRTPIKIRGCSNKGISYNRLSKRVPKIPDDFDGFLTPNGELVSLTDTGAMLSAISKHTENKNKVAKYLRIFAEDCLNRDHYVAACDYLEKALSIADDPDEKAGCLLRMGQVMEGAHDYKAALEAYLRAFKLPQKQNELWYFLNNNTAYCLNQLGDHQKAERYCRAAIEINPKQHNAHKNLGIALQNRGKHEEAARSYIQATKLNPSDSRAFIHLKQLLSGHKEIFENIPDLLGLLLECQQAVSAANGEDIIVQ
jgi:tetratricopeptide (TPR) repeat protein